MSSELTGKDVVHEASQVAARALRKQSLAAVRAGSIPAREYLRAAMQWEREITPSEEDQLPRNLRVPILEINQQVAGEAFSEALVHDAQAFLHGINFPIIQGAECSVAGYPNGIMVIEIANVVDNEKLFTRFIVNPEAEKLVEAFEKLFDLGGLLPYFVDPGLIDTVDRDLDQILAVSDEVDNEELFSVIGVPGLTSESAEGIEVESFSHMVALSQLAEADSGNNLVTVAEPLLGVEIGVADKNGTLVNQSSVVISRGFSLEAKSLGDQMRSRDSEEADFANLQVDKIRARLSVYGRKIGIGNIYVHPASIYNDGQGRYIVTNMRKGAPVSVEARR